MYYLQGANVAMKDFNMRRNVPYMDEYSPSVSISDTFLRNGRHLRRSHGTFSTYQAASSGRGSPCPMFLECEVARLPLKFVALDQLVDPNSRPMSPIE